MAVSAKPEAYAGWLCTVIIPGTWAGRAAVIGAMLALITTATAGELEINPTASVSGFYSDNINLAPPEEAQDEWILEATPGLGITATGNRLELSTDYRLQTLTYLHEDRSDRLNHQLQGSATGELIENHLFLEANSGIRQQTLSPQNNIALDNINQGNRGTVYTTEVGPRLTTRLDDWASLESDYRYSLVRYETGAQDSDIHQVNAALASGPALPRISWQANYNASIEDRETTADLTRQDFSGRLGYQVTRTWQVFGQGGYSDNDINTTRGVNNGTYWAAGLNYAPTDRYTFEVAFGPDYKIASATLELTPRTQLSGSWRDTNVGINTGTVWQGSLQINNRRWRLSAGYTERVTTTQRLALGEPSFNFVDPVTGEIVTAPEPGQTVEIIPSRTFELTDEVFIERDANIGFGITGARTAIQLSAFYRQRSFLDEDQTSDSRGGDIGINRQLGARSSLDLTTGLRDGESGLVANANRLVFVDLGLTKGFPRELNLRAAYRHTRETGRNAANDYQENRASLTLSKQF